MKKLSTLFLGTVLTMLALVPAPAGASRGYVCDYDCECSFACWPADGYCGYAADCWETNGNACYC
jgi:hypothetical protein